MPLMGNSKYPARDYAAGLLHFLGERRLSSLRCVVVVNALRALGSSADCEAVAAIKIGAGTLALARGAELLSVDEKELFEIILKHGPLNKPLSLATVPALVEHERRSTLTREAEPEWEVVPPRDEALIDSSTELNRLRDDCGLPPMKEYV